MWLVCCRIPKEYIFVIDEIINIFKHDRSLLTSVMYCRQSRNGVHQIHIYVKIYYPYHTLCHVSICVLQQFKQCF